MSVWFITGSSRGFGRALVQAAVAAGHRVVATARRPEQLADLVEERPDAVAALALDVTDREAVAEAIAGGVERFGRLDVIVNNAGYANVAPIETAEDGDVRAQFETNFWGVHNVSKMVIPLLRSQGGGTIVQFSSMGGRVGGSPGIAAYQAAKFAVDGFSRVLAAETAPFGIRVMVVEPSGFATDWAGSSMAIAPVPEDYEQTVAEMARRRAAAVPAGAPDRAAEIIVRTVDMPDLPSHLLVGAVAASAAIDYSRGQIAQATEWTDVSRSADSGEPYPVPLPSEPAQE